MGYGALLSRSNISPHICQLGSARMEPLGPLVCASTMRWKLHAAECMVEAQTRDHLALIPTWRDFASQSNHKTRVM
jgi:hypothetical protein